MKNCFYDKETNSIADVCDYYGEGWIVTRINVPTKHRDKGIGSLLLHQICDEADKHRETLFLEILPSGRLGYNDLKEWYLRYGFREVTSGFFRRRPGAQRSPRRFNLGAVHCSDSSPLAILGDGLTEKHQSVEEEDWSPS